VGGAVRMLLAGWAHILPHAAGQAGARPVCGLGRWRPVSPAKGEIRRTPAPPKRRAFKRRGIFRFSGRPRGPK